MLTLYIGDKNLSSWSLRAWLVVERTGRKFKEVIIPLDQKGTKEAIVAKSPSGRVPALKDGELLIWDSLAIAEYLAEKYPDKDLWPKRDNERAVARAVSSEMHSGFAALRQGMPMNICKVAPGEGKSDAVSADIARICEIWRECRKKYGAGGEFLFGRFTIADAFFAPVATRFGTYGVDVDKTCSEYVRAIRAWPAMVQWTDGARAEVAAS